MLYSVENTWENMPPLLENPDVEFGNIETSLAVELAGVPLVSPGTLLELGFGSALSPFGESHYFRLT